ncbi:UTRA domain-containing protein [Kosakonia quasisacchari]|uniref:UTRA domain-containing protein n=1 Tax=Kosakonia quasisacchari TaxID=2529380 RepID=A0A4R0HW27_9ENTR|nr:UTRA domain-containing protein [Kosakonia quasisacchari]
MQIDVYTTWADKMLTALAYHRSRECRLLHIKEHDPCLLIRRRTWSTPHIVSNVSLLFPGDRYRLQRHFAFDLLRQQKRDCWRTIIKLYLFC